MRPETLDDALFSIFDVVKHAADVQVEARGTSDEEDEHGNTIDPIHRYASSLVKEAFPLAVLGIFLLLYRRTDLPKGPDQ